jgi:hypothetical protein
MYHLVLCFTGICDEEKLILLKNNKYKQVVLFQPEAVTEFMLISLLMPKLLTLLMSLQSFSTIHFHIFLIGISLCLCTVKKHTRIGWIYVHLQKAVHLYY